MPDIMRENESLISLNYIACFPNKSADQNRRVQHFCSYSCFSCFNCHTKFCQNIDYRIVFSNSWKSVFHEAAIRFITQSFTYRTRISVREQVTLLCMFTASTNLAKKVRSKMSRYSLKQLLTTLASAFCHVVWGRDVESQHHSMLAPVLLVVSPRHCIQ